MSKKSSPGVISTVLLQRTPHSRLRRNTMPYTDLSYYKLNVHFQIRPVWPERLQARNGVPKPFFFFLFIVTCHCFQSFRKAALVL